MCNIYPSPPDACAKGRHSFHIKIFFFPIFHSIIHTSIRYKLFLTNHFKYKLTVFSFIYIS